MTDRPPLATALSVASCTLPALLFVGGCSSNEAPAPAPTARTASVQPFVAPAATSTALTTQPTPATATSAAGARPPTATASAAATPRDATYEVAGRLVTLAAGASDVPAAPGSGSRVVTQHFGNEATGDFNGDGLPDVGFVLTQSTGGSGTFYYAVVALRTKDGYVGTNAVLLGDRIAPQTTEARDGTLIVNYADRKPGEPMTTQPSVGVSKYLRVTGGRLAE
ncbi:MAG: hypothetical protein EXR63_05280 [Dehalococcoidia bacterium]|nr:hypothetical protein [Dehalococcoidia bacterium]